jgi:hypothetical protein
MSEARSCEDHSRVSDAIMHRAKAEAIARRTSVRDFVIEAVTDKVGSSRIPTHRAWMAGFGKLRHLSKESARISRLIEEEFEQLEG